MPSNKLPTSSSVATPDDNPTGAPPAVETAGRSGVREGAPRSLRPPAPLSRDEELPRELTPQYRLDRLIAVGGMGRVYAATQLALGRSVAVKLLATQQTNEDFRKRFFLEASISSRLVHRNIVTVHDYGEAAGGGLFMVMELLPGEPLTALLEREKRLSPERACRIAVEICRGLRAAHREGIAHRDLKPGNVMILAGEDEGESDRVKVLDFGLVKVFQETQERSPEQDLTQGDTMLGSPRYMAPEQIVCDPVDNRADIYALGVVLFSMVSGAVPFSGRSTVEILRQHMHTEVPLLRERVVLREGELRAPELPAALDEIIARCMQKKPSDRYQTIDEVMQALAGVYSGFAAGRVSADATGVSFDSIGSGATPRLGSITPTPIPSPSLDALAPTSSPSRARIGAIVALVLALSALALVISLLAGEAEPVAIEPPPAPPVEVADEPVVAALPTTRLTVTSDPIGAEVRLGGRLLGVTPLETSIDRPDASGQVSLELTLADHRTAIVPAWVRGDAASVHAELQRNTVAPAPPAIAPPIAAPRERAQRDRGHARQTTTAPVQTSEPARSEPRRSIVIDDERRSGVPIVD